MAAVWACCLRQALVLAVVLLTLCAHANGADTDNPQFREY